MRAHLQNLIPALAFSEYKMKQKATLQNSSATSTVQSKKAALKGARSSKAQHFVRVLP